MLVSRKEEEITFCIRRPEPSPHSFRRAIDVTHHPDLLIAFADGALVDAKSIDPEDSGLAPETCCSQEGMKILSYWYDSSIDLDDRGRRCWTPDIGAGSILASPLSDCGREELAQYWSVDVFGPIDG